MNITDSRKRLEEANRLLVENSTSGEKLESLSAILKGLNPKLDKDLQSCAENFSKIESLQSGDVISLTAQSIPEKTEEEKKRKKAILAFIRTWKDLKEEVARVKSELENNQGTQQQAQGAGRIMAHAKGPFGLITLAAILVVGFLAITNLNKSSAQSGTKVPQDKIKVIIVDGKKIPLTELIESKGPECDQAEHFHAKNHTSAMALDGSNVSDPGGCGFGKVAEVEVVETE